MSFLLNNPLVRLLARLWWLPALALLLIWSVYGEVAARPTIGSLSIGLAFLVGTTGVVALHGAFATSRKRLRSKREHHRFLCPECLQFGPVCYACAGCGTRLPEALIATNGWYARYCLECDTPITENRVSTARAICAHCQTLLDKDRWQEHRICVMATLLPEDHLRLCKKLGIEEPKRDEDMAQIVDAQTIFVLINLSACALPEVIPNHHALRHLDALWFSGLETDTLVLARAVDRLLRHLGQTTAENNTIPVFVEQSECDPAVLNMLSSRFHKVTFNPAPAVLADPQDKSEERPDVTAASSESEKADAANRSEQTLWTR